MDGQKTRVLIVDDSKAMCKFLTDILSSDPSLKVVGQAFDPYEARDMIKMLHPDVVTLDVEMPRMDGLTFLENLMRLRPMPVVMLSSLTAAGAEVTLRALSLGAVDFLVKRHPGGATEYQQYARDITAVVRNAAKAKLNLAKKPRVSATTHADFHQWTGKLKRAGPLSDRVARVVAIGASTGGPEAIREVLENLSAPDCAVVVSQHMPQRFMEPFAQRLDSLSSFSFDQAKQGEPILPGRGYVAPGDRHLKFRRFGSELQAVVCDGPKCNDHRPAVDVMYKSLAEVSGPSSLGVLLTGMGQDGAAGLKAMHNSGAVTFAQDERSSAVWGMPGSAIKLGAADATLSLREIGPTVEKLLSIRG